MIEQPGEAMAEVENVRVAFPDFGHVWNAAPSELELEIAALSIVIGARVKVRATVARAPADAPLHASAHHGALASPQVRSTVARPRCSWPDGVDHRSVGSVRRVMPDGVCFVRFAVSPRWLSFDLAELEAASTEDEATAQAAHDDGWASLKAGDRRRVGGLLRAPQHAPHIRAKCDENEDYGYGDDGFQIGCVLRGACGVSSSRMIAAVEGGCSLPRLCCSDC